MSAWSVASQLRSLVAQRLQRLAQRVRDRRRAGGPRTIDEDVHKVAARGGLGSLVGVEDCKATGIVFIFLGPSLLVCGVLSTYFMHQWNQMLSFSAALKNVAKRTSFIAGELLVALGILLISFGWACAADSDDAMSCGSSTSSLSSRVR